MLKEAYGENSLSLMCVLLNGTNGFLKAERTPKMTNGQPVSVSTPQTATKINEMVHGDHRMSIRMIAETVNADKETVRKILHDEVNIKSFYEVGP